MGSVVQAWASRDPFGALEWVNANDDLPNRTYFLEAIFGYAAKKDPVAARNAMEHVPLIGSYRFGLERKIVAEWAASSPAKAIEMIRDTANAQQRAILFEEYITRASPTSDEVLQLLSELNISVTTNHSDATAAAVRRAFADIAKESPARALRKAADALGIGSQNFKTAVRSIAEDSAATNPAAAADWAFGLPESEATRELRETVLRTWLKAAPNEVAQFLETKNLLIGGSRKVSSEVELLTRSWAEADAPGLLNWAANLHVRDGARILENAVRSAGWHHPLEAAKFIDSLPTPKAQSQAISAVASGLQRTDPLTAVEWLVTQRIEHDVGDSLAQSAEAAVLANPQAASQLISELPSGSRRDQAITGMVDALLSRDNPSRDLGAAAEWAATISSPDLQKVALDKVKKNIPKEN